MTSEQALQTLLDGNKRFVAGQARHPNQSSERLAELVARGQHPIAIIVSCSDSRIPPELVFDQGLGDIFVVRTAGQVLDDAALASIEYAAEHLHVPLAVVLGHQDCGAVKAAVGGGDALGHISTLVKRIQPAVEEARDKGGDVLDGAVRIHTLSVARQIESSEPILSELVTDGRLKVVGAYYSLASGEVQIF